MIHWSITICLKVKYYQSTNLRHVRYESYRNTNHLAGETLRHTSGRGYEQMMQKYMKKYTKNTWQTSSMNYQSNQEERITVTSLIEIQRLKAHLLLVQLLVFM